jgi:hypothetical protein
MGIWQHIHTVTTTDVSPDLGRDCTGEFLNKNISLKLFFSELNVVGIVCSTNICQKKLKFFCQPFRNGSKHVNFFLVPKLTSVFAPICDFQKYYGCMWGIKHTSIVHMHGLKMYAKY